MISSAVGNPDSINLAGSWRLQLDRENAGVEQGWHNRQLSDRIELPGSLPGHGIGDPITVDTPWVGSIFDPSWFTEPKYAPYREPDNLKVPFWLQPETYYVGAAWYQREIEIPANWTGQRVTLHLERPHWKTTVWLDDTLLGSNDSLSIAHIYGLGTSVSPRRHVLTIQVDNSVQVELGENSHSISDHTQGNWNGIVGAIELQASSPVWVEDVQVYPDLSARRATVRGVLRNVTGSQVKGTVELSVNGKAEGGGDFSFEMAGDNQEFETTLALGAELETWDEFKPIVHQLTVQVSTDDTEAKQTIPFGLRDLSHDGRQLTINGRKLFLRGTLDCAVYPKTGHAPLDLDSWRKIFKIIQSHGLNHVRFHSWCPPRAAFTAADELGVYVQAEAATWPNQGATIGDGNPVDDWVEAETKRILNAYGNHPSFVLMASGNEPDGDNHEVWLNDWTERHKSADPRRLYTAAAAWPEVSNSDFHIRSEPRIQQWEQGLKSRINALPPETEFDYREIIRERDVPVVSHEIGQWCVYPNFREMDKYTGYLKPRNFEIFRESLAAHGMADQAHDFLIASGKLQTLCYKEDIESALRTPEMGGFQLLGLSDFSGQGTALVGVLDAFWEEKGYVTPNEFRRFCGPTVPLVRLDRRVFSTDETLSADVEVAHFGPSPLTGAKVTWRLLSEGGAVAAVGEFAPIDVAIGHGNKLGRVELVLGNITAPARYRLEVSVPTREELAVNDWAVWVYPSKADVALEDSKHILVVDELNAEAQAQLDAGGVVVLAIPPDRVAPDPENGPIALGFSSIFWNTAWTNGQAPHTLGILCDPKHPALAEFPTESHSDWQWWYAISKAGPMILDGLPQTLRPIVQVVDDWVTNRKLGLVWEARVGEGRLLVTSVDLSGELDPVRRQLRSSLLNYAGSEKFAPQQTVTLQAVSALISPQPRMQS
ncbi:sugar-binding domain-containing protein [Pelagicoccus sp. SDUM812002]|uniref:sugar-binding domain-containing protein n=1 Tax=Pelagicoccus sp. SDUM812002 TaxID=3041266 RepID=UPI00280DC58D|nr:sugar-binding domain-containing protein [Pelagicoccus sp. SDUM812002]MDQ8188301.1 glycoside hydrolase family 2 TIM barrel-domain containing protein [Pelagicoccus sp. SDUM812002]